MPLTRHGAFGTYRWDSRSTGVVMGRFGEIISKITGRTRCKSCGCDILLLGFKRKPSRFDINHPVDVDIVAAMAETRQAAIRYQAEIDADPNKFRRTGLVCKACRLVVCVGCAGKAADIAFVKGAASDLSQVSLGAKLICPECHAELTNRALLSQVKQGTLFE